MEIFNNLNAIELVFFESQGATIEDLHFIDNLIGSVGNDGKTLKDTLTNATKKGKLNVALGTLKSWDGDGRKDEIKLTCAQMDFLSCIASWSGGKASGG